MIPSSWWLALVGGVIIGGASLLLLLFNGRVFGVSGILGGVVSPVKGDTGWRVSILLGMISGGILLNAFLPQAFDEKASSTLFQSIAAGFLVGLGTRLGNGCTSGHGICGISRFSLRSIAATLTFLLFGILTATFIGSLGGVK